MKHLDLFSGIGGFALAARNVGWETVGFCEIDPYCQKVLAKHWPGVPIYDDITKYEGQSGAADVITGGFPCQDISYAGKGAGIDGERSGLWTELARIIGEIRPRWAVLENVAALLSRGLDRVAGDLAEIGYDCEWHCIPASAVGAPHRRDRIWIVAYPNKQRRSELELTQSNMEQHLREPSQLCNGQGETKPHVADTERKSIGTGLREGEQERIRRRRSGDSGGKMADTQGKRMEGNGTAGIEKPRVSIGPEVLGRYSAGSGANQWSLEPNVGRVANGVPRRVDRLRGLGNAIVPQVAQVIFEAICESQAQSV